jgi:integrase
MPAPAKFRFTDALLKKLKAPDRPFAFYYDAEVSGLCFRITKNDARAFVLRYRIAGRERYISIGRFSTTATPEWTVTGARTKASELKGQIRLGIDPQEEVRAERNAKTIGDMIERYRADYFPRLRPSSQRDYGNLLKHDFASLNKIVLTELSFSDVEDWFRKLTKRAPIRANMAHSVLRMMLNLAISWEWIDKNVALRIKHNPAEKRARYLSPDEITSLTDALANEEDRQGANIVRLLLLTGARRGEVQSARWDDVDLSQQIWVKPAAATKQKKLHRIPLSAPACQLLADLRNTATSEWVFPAGSESGHRVEIQKTWYSLCRAAKIKDARIHDLRHTHASILASAGLSLHVIGQMLGHSSAQTTHRYAHLADDPLRRAAETAGAIITGGSSAEVIPMRKH